MSGFKINAAYVTFYVQTHKNTRRLPLLSSRGQLTLLRTETDRENTQALFSENGGSQTLISTRILLRDCLLELKHSYVETQTGKTHETDLRQGKTRRLSKS